MLLMLVTAIGLFFDKNYVTTQSNALYLALNWHIGTLQNYILKWANWLIFKLPYFISFVTAIAILLVLPATMMCATWLGALVGYNVVLQYKYQCIQQIRQFLNIRSKKVAAMIAAEAVASVFVEGIYHLKKDSTFGKLFIWKVTLDKTVPKSLFVYGVGRFEAEYNNWQVASLFYKMADYEASSREFETDYPSLRHHGDFFTTIWKMTFYG
jgi:hypothetical protein